MTQIVQSLSQGALLYNRGLSILSSELLGELSKDCKSNTDLILTILSLICLLGVFQLYEVQH